MAARSPIGWGHIWTVFLLSLALQAGAACSAAQFAGEDRSRPARPAGSSGKDDGATDRGRDDDGGEDAKGGRDGSVDANDGGDGDAGIDGDGDAGGDSDLGSNDGQADAGIQVEEVTIKALAVGSDGVIRYYYTSGLNLWSPASAGQIEPPDAVTKLQEIGESAVASGISLKSSWGGWGMYVKETVPRATTDTVAVRTGECATNEVVVGFEPQGAGLTDLVVRCASLKTVYQLKNRTTVPFTWDENSQGNCPGASVMVGRQACQNAGCNSPTSAPLVCAEIKKKA